MLRGENMQEGENNTAGDIYRPFVELIIESWRLAKLFQRVLGKLDATEANRYINQVRYFQRRVDDSLALTGMSLVTLEGQHYDPGMAITPLNIADFGPDEMLIVDQMIEPILMGQTGIIKSGTALLKQAVQL
jgi:hypothetical protein